MSGGLPVPQKDRLPVGNVKPVSSVKPGGLVIGGKYTGLELPSEKAPAVHPIQKSERNYTSECIRAEMHTAKKLGGAGLPQQIFMEIHAASQVGRLPCLPSSNLMLDTLLGTDETLECGDYLNNPDFMVDMVNPHPVGDILKN